MTSHQPGLPGDQAGAPVPGSPSSVKGIPTPEVAAIAAAARALMPEPPMLIASDVDGTLINSKERVTPATLAALRHRLRAGTVVALATGRPPRWIHPVLEQLGIRPVCVCANGAIVYDSASDTMLRVNNLSPAVLSTVVRIAKEHTADLGGVTIAVERGGTSALAPTQELFVVTPEFHHAWVSDEHGVAEESEILRAPAIKLLLRNPQVSSEVLWQRIAPHVSEDLAHITYSIDEGLLEVAAPGVNKAAGVAYLAELIGVDPAQVLCFGDMPNDQEMLAWAGLGVAMGNAHERLKAFADLVTTSNDDDGIAAVLAAWD